MKHLFTIWIFSTLCSLLAATGGLFAATGDTTRVPMYRDYRFYTKGDMRLDTATAFPAPGKTYSSITFKLKLACPCGKLMGEWDYTVTFFARRPTGRTDSLGKPVYEFVEIARFITPYWGNRPVATNYTWEWDVTDYASLLQGDVVVRTDYSGYSQSALFTSWFEFVEGIPPYNVLGIQTLWQGSWVYGDDNRPINNNTTGKKFKLPGTAKAARLKIITTGHGGGGTDNAAEFSDKTHEIWVGGAKRYDQRLWREDCMINPVYPQDGTWPLSRGGWCPGDVIVPWNNNVTEFLAAGDSTVVDYKFQPFTNLVPSKQASYTSTGQVIFTSSPNYTNNVALLAIKAPNNAAPNNRMNPICNKPVVRIKNLGSNTLKELKISYDVLVHQWTGNLPFLAETDVELPTLGSTFQEGQGLKDFAVKLSLPNNVADEDSSNNSGKATFVLPPVYYNDVEIRLRTNKQAAAQYSYTLTNAQGELVTMRSGLADNTDYVDSLNLPDGCYEFRFKNRYGYGLSWWATQADLGSGSLKLSSLGQTMTTFPGDFGGEIFHQFRVGQKPGAITSATELDFGSVELNNKKELEITITPKNEKGLEITAEPYISLKNRGYEIKSKTPDFTGKLQLKSGESLKLTVEFTPTSAGNKVTYLNIPTNDQRSGTLQVRLNGWGGPITGVEEQPELQPTLTVQPSVSADEFALNFTANGATSIALVNALGREVATVYEGNSHAAQELTLKTGAYPSGMYYLVLRTGGATATAPLVIAR